MDRRQPGSGSRLGRGGEILLLLVVCLSVGLPGFFSLPVVDRDEARFAQASRQMFESVALDEADPALHDGGLLIPKVQSKWRLNKPPLIYWAQAASAGVFTLGDPLDDAIWMYRVPSLLAFIVTVLATWSLGRRMFPGAVGLYAGLMMALAPVFVWEAHQARADQVMIAFTTLAMRSLWIAFESGRRRDAMLGAAFVALGVLTKGPITPMVVLLTIAFVASVTRSWTMVTRARLLTGALVTLAAIGAWIVPVALRIGPETYFDLVWDETIGRSVEAKEGHSGPPGYHLVFLVILFWPGVLLTGLAIRRAIRLGRRGTWFGPWRGRRQEIFLLGWLVPSWIFFEVVSTKLPHYTMPLYPAIALLSARALFAGPRLIGLDERVSRLGFFAWCLPSVVLLTIAPSLLYALLRMDDPPVIVPMVVASLGGVFLFAMLWRRIARGLFIDATRLAFFASGASCVLIFGLLFPRAESLWVTRGIRDRIEPGNPVATLGYLEDSLIFHTRGRIERLAMNEVEVWFAVHPDGVLLAPNESPWIDDLGVVVRGYNYPTGRWVQVKVIDP